MSIGILSIWFIFRYFALKDSAPVAFTDMIKSVYFNLPAVVQFIGKIFFPFNLSVLPIIQDTTFLYGFLSIILLAIIFFITKTKRWSFILFGFGWFFVFLLPSFIRPNNLGAMYYLDGNMDNAEKEYKKELEIKSYYDNAFFNLGLLYWEQKRYEEAEINWKKTLEVNPNYIDAVNALTIFYYTRKNYKEMTIYANELYRRGYQLPLEILKLLQT